VASHELTESSCTAYSGKALACLAGPKIRGRRLKCEVSGDTSDGEAFLDDSDDEALLLELELSVQRQ